MKNKQIISLITLIGILTMSGCGNNADDVNYTHHETQTSSGNVVDPDSIVLEDGCFHTKLQMAYINSSYDTVGEFANGTIDLSNPAGNTINFTKTGGKILQVSSFADFHEDASTPYLDTRMFDISNHTAANIKNLLSDTTYYWRTFTTDEITTTPLETGTFKTCNHLPRFIDIDDKKMNSKYVTNVRDMGGYTTYLPGYTKVKQGLIYRSGRMSGSATVYAPEGQTLKDFDNPYLYEDSGQPEMLMSDAGYSMLINTLGMKGEIDLRNDTIKVNSDGSYYVENGKRAKYPGIIPGIKVCEAGIFAEKSALLQDLDDRGLSSGYAQIKKSFDFYSDPSNFPNFVHCYIGTDRTGCVCYLLECLLGMSDVDMYKDYLWSNYGLIGGSRSLDAIKTYEAVLKKYGKATMAENAEALLTSSKIGITKSQINTIRETLLEKAA